MPGRFLLAAGPGIVVEAPAPASDPDLLDLSRDVARAVRALKAVRAGKREVARAIAGKRPTATDSYPPRS